MGTATGGRVASARARLPLSPQLVLLLAFGGVSVLNYGFGLVAATLLSPGDFGLLGFAQTLLLICGLVLQSGIPWGLTRASVGAAAGRRAALARGALVVNLALAAGLGAAVAGLYALGPLGAGLETWSVTLAVCAALGPFAVIAVARAVAQGMERFGANAAIQTLEVVGKVAVGLALAALGLGAAGAVLGFTVGAAMATGLGLWFLRRSLGFGARGGVAWPAVRDSGAMFGALLGIAVLLNQDLLAVKLAANGREETGYYQAAIILANAPYFLVAAALIPVLFTQLARRPSLAESAPATGRVLAATAVFVAPMAVLLAAVPGTALRLCFPDGYDAAAGELRLLALGNLVVIAVAVLSTAFQAVGRAAVPARVLLGVAGAELVALAVVVPRAGAEGAAATFGAAALVAALLLGGRYLRETRPADRRALGAWAGRFAVAAAAGGAAAAAAWAMAGPAAGVAAGAAAYLAGVAGLGLLRGAVLTLVRLAPRDGAADAPSA